MPSKEIDRRAAYKKNKNSFDMLKKASGNKIKGVKFDPVALGIIKKKKTGGVEKVDRSQSTGSFIGDLKKAIKAGGASKMTKSVKVKKGDTLSDIAKANNTTLKMLMDLNPKFKTGQKKQPTNVGKVERGTVQQKEMQLGSTVKVPDPQTFTGFKLRAVKSKKKKDVYDKVTKPEFKEMAKKIHTDKTLKSQQKKVAMAKKMGGTMVKKAMGGVMRNRGGTFKGTF